MGAIWFLYRRTFVNRFKKALHRPGTYVYFVILLFYLVVMPLSLRFVAQDMNLDSPTGMASVLTILAFWSIPANLIAYARRKGLVFRNSDVHFLFSAPLSPKQILLFTRAKGMLMEVLLIVFALCCGGFLFKASAWQLVLYGILTMVLQKMLEGSTMLLLYGSEGMGENGRKAVMAAAYGLVGVLVLIGLYTYVREGLTPNSVHSFLHSDMVQLVPLVGWYIAVIHLIFVGPTAVNLTATVLYLLTLTVAVAAAVRLKCTGGYYEDAMKFADDYEEILTNRRRGVMKTRTGVRVNRRKVNASWLGNGAKALFFRQLLEYKKSRFFIFDVNTLAAAIGGAGIAYYVWNTYRGEQAAALEHWQYFIIPGVSAYVIFIFTAYGGKWLKELRSPYTYLIPDYPFRKMVYATAMQHVQSLVNGCLITIPGAVIMGMSLPLTVLCILSYVLIMANRLYATAVAEAALADSLGQTAKQLLQMLFQGIAITMAVMGAILGIQLGGELLGFVLLDLFLLLVTMIFMVIAALNFDAIQI